MIFIFSQPHDTSTNLVIDWLYYYDQKTIRINSYSEFFHHFGTVKIENNKNNSLGNLTKKISIWYRRRGVLAAPFPTNKIDQSLIYQFGENLRSELKILFEYTFEKINKNAVAILGSEKGSRLNKLRVLDIAQSIGLNIPKTLITNRKTAIIEFLQSEKSIITKAISEATFIVDKKSNKHAFYTQNISKKKTTELDDEIFPSLLQQEIKKEFEIRTYYIDGKCYSMAIFSQQSAQTATDFRVYDTVNRNRNIPYQLPKEIERQLKKLMTRLQLKEGSIDLIKTKDNKIVFLEVNPSGQFGMVSRPCNYHLEEKIAKYLSHE